MRKRESPKNGWDTGVCIPGAFKLDHLQPVQFILPKKFSNFMIFILGLPFLITPERGNWEKGSGGTQLYTDIFTKPLISKYKCREKGIHPKMDETQGFQYLEHSNWTICSLLSWFCSNKFPTSSSLYWGSHFLLPQRGEMEKKGITQKWMRQRGFCNWSL